MASQPPRAIHSSERCKNSSNMRPLSYFAADLVGTSAQSRFLGDFDDTRAINIEDPLV